MLISDLPYLEKISEKNWVLGGALLALEAEASVGIGSSLTSTDVDIKSNKNGKVTKVRGIGTALAMGTDPQADIYTYYEGFDKVKIKVRSGKGENYAFETIRVIAIDVPR